MASTTSTLSLGIDKLLGRENFNTWQFAVKNYLEHEGLWDTVEKTGDDAKIDTKARTKIILLINPINYVHVEDCTTAKQVWDKLKTTFEDSGLYRKVSLIRELTSTRLENCTSIEDYVNKIITAAHKLRNIDGNNVSDDWIAIFLLAGLPDRYKPMIMAIENCGMPLTSDAIKTKLLQDVKSADNALPKAFHSYKGKRRQYKQHQSSQSLSSKNQQNPLSTLRCHVCQEVGHFARNCLKKKKVQ